MQEPFWNMLANGDSPFYTSLRGNGYVKWESGCFVNFDMSALKYEELLLLSFFDEEFTEYIFDAVSQCDELIFKTFDENYGKEF